MYKIDKTKFYSVTDVIKENFDSCLPVRGYFINSLESLDRPDEFIVNHYELEQMNSLREDCFRASNGKW